MSKVYLFGDIHGQLEFAKLSKFYYANKDKITKDDFFIILGDFGLIWGDTSIEKQYLNILDKKFKCTVLFVDGNHENFDLINQYPVEIKWGGKVHKIKKSVYHLMRGQVFQFGNKKFLTFGGGFSIDYYMRIEHESWWKQELPTIDECNECIDNLELNDMKVDYILTHDMPKTVAYSLGFLKDMSMYIYDANQIHIQSYFNMLYQTVKFSKWYCGHMHIDKDIGDLKVIYKEVEEIEV